MIWLSNILTLSVPDNGYFSERTNFDVCGFFLVFFICVIFIPRFFELTINSEKRVINYLYHEAMQRELLLTNNLLEQEFLIVGLKSTL
jgi:hypothetical protein